MKVLKGNQVLPYIFVLPAFLLILVFKLYPILTSLIEGFTYQGEFSLRTYELLLKDATFWNALWITIKMNLIMTPLQILLAFFMALLVNTTIQGIGGFRTVLYLPVTISMPVAAIIWSMMFDTNNGVINSIIGLLGIPSQGFLIDNNQALWCIVIICTWKGVGYWMMFILAGLKNIDKSIYESARMDGVSFFTLITRITIPLLKRVFLFVIVADTTINLLLFAPMQLITKGGPLGSTNVLMYEAYKSAFQFIDRPRSSAIISILLVIIIITSVIQFVFMHEKDDVAGVK